jgi:hypothetical protein
VAQEHPWPRLNSPYLHFPNHHKQPNTGLVSSDPFFGAPTTGSSELLVHGKIASTSQYSSELSGSQRKHYDSAMADCSLSPSVLLSLPPPSRPPPRLPHAPEHQEWGSCLQAAAENASREGASVQRDTSNRPDALHERELHPNAKYDKIEVEGSTWPCSSRHLLSESANLDEDADGMTAQTSAVDPRTFADRSSRDDNLPTEPAVITQQGNSKSSRRGRHDHANLQAGNQKAYGISPDHLDVQVRVGPEHWHGAKTGVSQDMNRHDGQRDSPSMGSNRRSSAQVPRNSYCLEPRQESDSEDFSAGRAVVRHKVAAQDEHDDGSADDLDTTWEA